MCGQSLREVGQGVLELLIGNKKVTDGQTDRPSNRHVQSNMPFLLSKVGIIKLGNKTCTCIENNRRKTLFISFHIISDIIYFNSISHVVDRTESKVKGVTNKKTGFCLAMMLPCFAASMISGFLSSGSEIQRK